jgi:Zn-dependent peptidase ImmA (M78 family)
LLLPLANNAFRNFQTDNRITNGESIEYNSQILSKIYSFLAKRDDAINWLKEIGETPQAKLPSFNYEKDTVEEIARYIRKRFIVEKKATKDFLSRLIENLTNDADIMIFSFARGRQMKKLRGFALYFEVLPIIGIANDGEAYVGKLFSLLHELAHILIKSTMIDLGEYFRNSFSNTTIERFCNRVAVEVLLPKEVFDTELKDIKLKGDEVSLAEVENVCYNYHVSRDTFILRLKELKFISEEKYKQLLSDLEAKRSNEKTSKSGGRHTPAQDIQERSLMWCKVAKKAYQKDIMEFYELRRMFNKTAASCYDILAAIPYE